MQSIGDQGCQRDGHVLAFAADYLASLEYNPTKRRSTSRRRRATRPGPTPVSIRTGLRGRGSVGASAADCRELVRHRAARTRHRGLSAQERAARRSRGRRTGQHAASDAAEHLEKGPRRPRVGGKRQLLRGGRHVAEGRPDDCPTIKKGAQADLSIVTLFECPTVALSPPNWVRPPATPDAEPPRRGGAAGQRRRNVMRRKAS